MNSNLTESKRKLVISIGSVKGRREHGLFIVEGFRALSEMATSISCKPEFIVTTQENLHNPLISTFERNNTPVYVINSRDYHKISGLKTPTGVMGVFHIPEYNLPVVDYLNNNLTIALDDIQDPGNLGTIIRLADWWGIEYVLCSQNTVDCYNPKVVQSAMGSIGRVKVIKCNLIEYLGKYVGKGYPIFGTFLKGTNIFTADIPDNGIIIFGNEGKGISPEIEKITTEKLTIPYYPPETHHVESLNVAMAVATVLSVFRSRKFL